MSSPATLWNDMNPILPFLLFAIILFSLNFILTTCYPTSSYKLEQTYRNSNSCDMCDSYEYFTNDVFEKYKKNYVYFGEADLTAKDTSKGIPSHLMTGKAKKYVVADSDEKQTALLEISSNLYLLDGNPYTNGQRPLELQKYNAFLVKKDTGERLLLGKLKLEQDGLYHLRIKTTNLSQLAGYNSVMVTYLNESGESVILTGELSTR